MSKGKQIHPRFRDVGFSVSGRGTKGVTIKNELSTLIKHSELYTKKRHESKKRAFCEGDMQQGWEENKRQ